MDNIFTSLSDWIKETIQNAVDKLVKMKTDELNAELWTREKVADKLNMSPATLCSIHCLVVLFPKNTTTARKN